MNDKTAKVLPFEIDDEASASGDPSLQIKFSRSLKFNDHRARGGVIFKWTGTHWEALDALELERQAIKFLVVADPEKTTDRLAKSAAATAALYLPELPARKENKRNGLPVPIIPTKSGYVEIGEAGEINLRPADREDGLTYVLDCDFDPSATATTFDAFLIEALPDNDVRSFLQEFAGYTLMGDTRHEVAAWLIGEGGTGKGTFGVIMQALHRKTIALSLDALDGFRLTGLADASLVYVDETPTGRIAEQTIKSCISGDMIQADRKNRDPISFAPLAKWIINGNHLPPLSDHTSGFWRRFIIFPFNVKPSIKRVMLAEQIVDTELPGVLNWALEGLKRLLARGYFPDLPEPMSRFRDEIKRSTDSVAGWADEANLKLIDGHDADKRIVYLQYSGWCREQGMKAVSSVNFWKRLGGLFPGVSDTQRRTDGRVSRFVNIQFDRLDFID